MLAMLAKNSESRLYKQIEVKFLGLKFNEKGMSPDSERVEVIKKLKNPSNKKELQQILGVTEGHKNIPDTIKSLISEKSLLVLFNANKPVQCDTSKKAIACCLLQEDNPVWFASRSLTETEQMYAIIEKELLAITFAVKKFHYYIYRHKDMKIYTDPQPLVSIIKKSIEKIENNRLKRLKLKLMNYNFILDYLPGKYMYIADLLTRNIIYKEEKDDESLRDLIHTVKVAEIKYSTDKLTELTVEDGLVYFNKRVVIPRVVRGEMLRRIHESHQGIEKSKQLAKQHVYWPGIMSDITNLVLTCLVCNKYNRTNKKTELMSHEIPKIPFDKVGADIAQLGEKEYLIIVNYFSRWVEVSKLKWKTAKEIIKKCKKIFARFGIPSILIADNMPFNSYQFRLFAKEWGMEINNSSPNYPVINGLAEKYVGIIKRIMKKCGETSGEIEDFLFNYRNTPLANIEIEEEIDEEIDEEITKDKKIINSDRDLHGCIYRLGRPPSDQDHDNNNDDITEVYCRRRNNIPRKLDGDGYHLDAEHPPYPLEC
ncbi:hypothetical protein QTP88_006616 [Uroleucon formosanum]